MKKGWMLLGISVLSLTALTGCASSADTMPSPSPSATMTTQASPEATMAPTVSIAPAQTMSPDMEGVPAGVNSVEDAKRISERIGDEVEKLSEVDEAEAVVAGNIALVGIQYDAQYQGGLTDRLKQMVEDRVDMVDKTITTVHVTDNAEQVKKIAQLREKLDNGGITFEQLQTQMLDLGSAIAGGGEANVSQPETNTGA